MNRPTRARARPPPQGTGSAGVGTLNFFFGNNANANDNEKHVVFVRHGTTEMNEYLHTQCNYYSPDFKDPLIFDTRLTRDGERRAKEAAARAQRLQPRPELIVASPLTRALQTAELAFGPLLDEGIPCLALPLARERLFLSSDVGRPGAELAAEFPRWRDSLLALEDEWWLHSRSGTSRSSGSESDGGETTPNRRSSRRRRLKTPTPKPNPAVEEEGDAEFAGRMDAFGEWLSWRPERCVAVVSHWGVILEATGHEFENVEMRAFRRAQLRL
jgi:broad specificity phosphatase PhoE